MGKRMLPGKCSGTAEGYSLLSCFLCPLPSQGPGPAPTSYPSRESPTSLPGSGCAASGALILDVPQEGGWLDVLTWQAPPELLNWPLTLLLPQGEAPWAQMTAAPHSLSWCSLPQSHPIPRPWWRNPGEALPKKVTHQNMYYYL